MKSFLVLCLTLVVALFFAATAHAQSPTISRLVIKDTGCVYSVGISTHPCPIAPGMTLLIKGSNFGPPNGVVISCDCPQPTTVNWTATGIAATVNTVLANATISVETIGGLFSNTIPYTPIAPVITSIAVGNCTYTPGQSRTLCKVNAGTQITINGSYFGPGTTPDNQAVTCVDCTAPTINSWDPNWLTKPSPYNNQIVITANEAECGSTIAVFAGQLWSNYMPYTAC